MNENNDKSNNEAFLAQEVQPVFIDFEETDEKDEQPDHSKVYTLPTIKTRYFSTLIDLLVILLLSFGISTLLEEIGQIPDYVRGILFCVVIFLYEPILITFGNTIGQFLMNIRVRNFKNPEKKLAFELVLFRFMIKIFLGWISFLTVTFNINKRAIHDFACGSIVIANKIENS